MNEYSVPKIHEVSVAVSDSIKDFNFVVYSLYTPVIIREDKAMLNVR